MTAQQIKDNTDLLIRQKTAQHSILKTEVAQQLDDIVDYINIISVTYLELLNLKNNSLLEIGRQYLLTDYMTEYIQTITAVFKSSGIVEQLILTATDVNKLHNECKSILYPQDVVYYEITGDIDNGYGNEGFTKGKIYRRIDTLRNNDIGTDWRHVKYDRLGVDKLLFEVYDSTIYNNTIKTYFLFDNVCGIGFSSNTIGDGFYSNGNITTPFLSINSIFSNFIQNINPIGTSEIHNKFIETFVYKTPSGTIKQRYYNNVDVLIFSIV